ncbi:DUF3168 domain-containing protein [Streptomyces malaysiensis subsp. malaysiensis]|uniref:DUF3168 domain-containing protein n=1 Tax=Streptomyces malaysiensis TaxID=92644 RepID=UPI0024BFCF1E|nr:DUF3168 domain-containing protein [Streptomyces sp. NA07423]WHX19829.1 DUF3168 domain-containing protein [Streptomyces sp. NA07423]
MTTALWPLQQAVVQNLRADAPLMALVSGIWDEVPEQAAFPYVTVGSITELVDDAHDQRGLTTTLVLHIWSKYQGFREAAEILAAVDAVLDRQPLAVTGYKDVSVAHQQHTELRDPDPEIRHINVTYRVWMTKE